MEVAEPLYLSQTAYKAGGWEQDLVSVSHLHPTTVPFCLSGPSRLCCSSRRLNLEARPHHVSNVLTFALFVLSPRLVSLSPLIFLFPHNPLHSASLVSVYLHAVSEALKTLSQHQFLSIPEYVYSPHLQFTQLCVSLTVSSFHVSSHISVPLYLASLSLSQSLGSLAALLPSSLFGLRPLYPSISPSGVFPLLCIFPVSVP